MTTRRSLDAMTLADLALDCLELAGLLTPVAC
jgi:hypothetical protein